MMPLPQATSSFLAAHSRRDASSVLSGTVLPLLRCTSLISLNSARSGFVSLFLMTREHPKEQDRNE
jgi:hypothetical protein